MAERLTPRKQQALEMRSRIQNVALDLFDREGFENVSVEEIAQTVGCSVGNIYHYFKSKDELAIQVTQMVDEAYTALEEEYLADRETSGREKLLDFVGRSLEISASDEMLYKNLLPNLVGGAEGYLLNAVIRMMPKQILLDTLDATVDGLTNVILRNCTTMWSLVPEAYYDEAVSRVLPGEENAEMRRQVEVYHHAQVNRFANIEKMRAAGAEVFDVVDYDYQLYCLVPSYDKSNADGIIHAESTSMGAKFAKIGETLGEGYVQQGTHCKNTAHNHLSPDSVVDASVGLLPDHTFYFKGQDHEKTGSNDVIMKLATELLTNPEFKDVYSMPDRFPQFNIGRNTKDLVNNLMKPAQEIDRSTLSPEDAAELDAALEECNAMLENTVVDPATTEHAQQRLENILIKIGEREAPNENEEKLSAVGEAISKFISDALYECVGAQGYYDAFQQLLELIGKYFPQPA